MYGVHCRPCLNWNDQHTRSHLPTDFATSCCSITSHDIYGCCLAAALLAEKAIIKQEALVNSVPLKDLQNLSEALEGLNTQQEHSNT